MKTLTQYITEASKAVKEFEDVLGLKFPSKAKVSDGVLTFDMDKKKYKTTWNGWFIDEFMNTYNRSSNNVSSRQIKDESELTWDFNSDSPKGNEKWITIFTLNTTSGATYEMVETQVRNFKTGKDHIYIAIKKA